MAFCNILFLYGADKELKYLNELGIKNAKMVNVEKVNVSLIYHKKPERIITKFVLVNIIIFYALDLLALVFLILHFAFKIDWLFVVSCVLLFSNVVGIPITGIKISLNNEQERIKHEDQKRNKNTK